MPLLPITEYPTQSTARSVPTRHGTTEPICGTWLTNSRYICGGEVTNVKAPPPSPLSLVQAHLSKVSTLNQHYAVQPPAVYCRNGKQYSCNPHRPRNRVLIAPESGHTLSNQQHDEYRVSS